MSKSNFENHFHVKYRQYCILNFAISSCTFVSFDLGCNRHTPSAVQSVVKVYEIISEKSQTNSLVEKFAFNTMLVATQHHILQNTYPSYLATPVCVCM